MDAKKIISKSRFNATPLINALISASSPSQLFEYYLQSKNYKNKVELALAVASEYRLHYRKEPPMGLVQGIVLWNRDLVQAEKGRGISGRQLDEIIKNNII